MAISNCSLLPIGLHFRALAVCRPETTAAVLDLGVFSPGPPISFNLISLFLLFSRNLNLMTQYNSISEKLLPSKTPL